MKFVFSMNLKRGQN